MCYSCFLGVSQDRLYMVQVLKHSNDVPLLGILQKITVVEK